ncbi:MAG: CDP-alcohol phosphatidyltransferase family protein [Caldilineaceae bacterium]|nr:CDP-alcohol phosphatidyltransferase family protein [Caldilineaceae bacterium]
MYDVSLRRKKDELLTPLAVRLPDVLHPNIISGVALLTGLASAAAIAQRVWALGLLLWIANRTLDGLDGVVARVHERQSDFGGYLDLLLDFVIYLTVPAAFVYANPTPLNLWALALLFASYVINTLSWTLLSALLEKRHRGAADRLTSVEMPGGLIEGAETIAFYTLFYFLPGYSAYLFLIFSLLVFVTAGQHVWWAARHLPD